MFEKNMKLKLELDVEKLDTTPTDFTEFAKRVDIKSFAKVREIVDKRKKVSDKEKK